MLVSECLCLKTSPGVQVLYIQAKEAAEAKKEARRLAAEATAAAAAAAETDTTGPAATAGEAAEMAAGESAPEQPLETAGPSAGWEEQLHGMLGSVNEEWIGPSGSGWANEAAADAGAASAQAGSSLEFPVAADVLTQGKVYFEKNSGSNLGAFSLIVCPSYVHWGLYFASKRISRGLGVNSTVLG